MNVTVCRGGVNCDLFIDFLIKVGNEYWSGHGLLDFFTSYLGTYFKFA